MSSDVSRPEVGQVLTLGLLPEQKTPWRKIVASYGVLALLVGGIVVTAILNPDILPVGAYQFVNLVSAPPPVPQTPAPIRHFPLPAPKVEEVALPRPDALRVPQEIVQKKTPIPEEQAPKVTLAAKKELLPDVKPVIPRPPVQTNVFSVGSSATPTMAAAPSKVQTGGFGDPNGLPAQDSHNRAINVAQAGSFDMPSGAGHGNGTGGSHGAAGVVASAGFGSGVATGTGTGVSGSRAAVHQGGFAAADVAPTSQPKAKVETIAKTLPAEITYKPRPVYTEEGRQLKIQGEVLLDVVFTSNGKVRVVKVVRGLGHGLDEAAVEAAQHIQFKPALREGQPADFEAVLHIVFELAS